MRALIEAGADVNKADIGGVTWLFAAAHVSHEAVVRSLIELGADVNKAIDYGATPLYIAAQEGHEAVVRALIEAGADVGVAAPGKAAVHGCSKRPRDGAAGADRVGR